MIESARRNRPLLVLCLVCLAILPFTLVAYLVNVEMAVRVFLPDWRCFSLMLPPRLFAFFVVLSADLSTISTMIPLMLVLYPLVQGARILRNTPRDPAFAAGLEADPYPPHFGFFLVMLGLTGTLYGMMIGLDVSGISNLAGKAPTAEMIRASLDRLLGGTATAILSSLVGLIGAFLVARPVLPWVFRRAAGLGAAEPGHPVTDTVEQLTADLRALSQASRAFAARLRPEAAASLIERLERQEAATREACAQLEKTNAALLSLGQTQQETNRRLERLDGIEKALQGSGDLVRAVEGRLETLIRTGAETNRKLDRLEPLETATRALLAGVELGNRHLAGFQEGQAKLHGLFERLLQEESARHRELHGDLAALAETARESRNTVARDQDALRRALALYVQTPPDAAPAAGARPPAPS